MNIVFNIQLVCRNGYVVKRGVPRIVAVKQVVCPGGTVLVLFTDEFDVRILAGHLNTQISRIRKLKNSIYFTIIGKGSLQKKNDYYLSPPFVYGFVYSQGLNTLNKANFKIMVNAFLEYFEQNILPDWKPDLIHAQNTNMSGIVAHYIFKKYLIPYIITDHHLLNPNKASYIQNEIKEALKFSKNNCFVSEWQYRTYLLLDSELRGTIIGNLLNEKLFVIKPKKKSPKFRIIHVSNGIYHKDILTLAQSLYRFCEKIQDFENINIVIIGFNKQNENKFKSLINNTILNKITFIERVHHEELPAFYNESDVFLFSSIFESFGLTPLEAMLCGVPVISTNNGGVNEYLMDGINGIKCQIKDPEAISQALYDIYIGTKKFDSKKIRGSVISKFNSLDFKNKLRDIYLTNA